MEAEKINALLKALLSSCLALVMLLPASFASELIMFEEEYCTWCEKWNEEIGVIYHRTPESCHAPLKKVDLYGGLADTFALKETVIYTPTFVLMQAQKEVARIVGYPGEDFFWDLLNEMIQENIPSAEQLENLANCSPAQTAMTGQPPLNAIEAVR